MAALLTSLDAPEGVFINGEIMSKKSFQHLMTGSLLCAVLSVYGQTLPEGPGKQTVETVCNSCHAFSARVGGGYTARGWATVLRMMSNQGLNLSSEQLAEVSDYLVKNFPEKPRPASQSKCHWRSFPTESHRLRYLPHPQSL